MSTKCVIVADADGIVHDPGSTEVLTRKWTFNRFLKWFGSLSDLGQSLVWLAVGLPITALVIVVVAAHMQHH